MPMVFRIKDEQFENFKANSRKYGFLKDCDGNYCRYFGNRKIVVCSTDKTITDIKATVYGFMGEGEYRHRTRTYSRDLIADGYVEIKGVKYGTKND